MLYLGLLKAIYGMLQSALRSYIKLRKYLDTYGFKFNPYEPCVANNITEVEPLIVVFHVDDVKESHRDTNMVDNFEQWIEFMYGDPNIGKFKSLRGKVHEYLSTNLYYTTKGEVKIDTRKYVKNMIDELTIKIEKYQAVSSPETENIFKGGWK